MTKKRTPQHLRKRKTKLTSWSTLFQVVRTSTSQNLQKKRREIRLKTKKKNPQKKKKRKIKLNRWFTLFQVLRTNTNKKKIKYKKYKKKNPPTPKKEKNETYRLVHAIPSRPDVYKPKTKKKKEEKSG